MRHLLFLVSLVITLNSCKVFRSNLMLKTGKDYSYDTLVDSISRIDYKIAANDAFLCKIVTNNGMKLIDPTVNANIIRNDYDAVVESDGSIKLPLLGRINILGLTVKEAEKLLEEKYATLYVDPYVSLKITNKRIIVFPGNGGSAKVLSLNNNNTTILEALANAGGILEDGKAYKVKLIRNNPDPTKKAFVYLMDLSTIGGIKAGNSIAQAGDIIYVEPRYRPLNTFSREVAPLITLLTSVLLLIQFSSLR